MEYKNGFLLFAINKTGGLSRVNKDVYASTGEALASKEENGIYIVMPCFVAEENDMAYVDFSFPTPEVGTAIVSLQEHQAMEYFNAVVDGAMSIHNVPEPLKTIIVRKIIQKADGLALLDPPRLVRAKFDQWITLFLTWLKSEDGQKHLTEDHSKGEADTKAKPEN